MKESKIFSLVMVSEAGQYLITLEEVNGTRLVPIWIGPAEGISIAAALAGQAFPRPLTHDLIINILNEMKANIKRVVITDLKDDTFYANIIMDIGGKEYSIDSRPSDSIAIAVRAKAAIFIEDKVFDKCPPIQKPITAEEVKKFKEHIENLRPEDFFREKKDG